VGAIRLNKKLVQKNQNLDFLKNDNNAFCEARERSTAAVISMTMLPPLLLHAFWVDAIASARISRMSHLCEWGDFFLLLSRRGSKSFPRPTLDCPLC
jgi:hypothetical protein